MAIDVRSLTWRKSFSRNGQQRGRRRENRGSGKLGRDDRGTFEAFEAEENPLQLGQISERVRDRAWEERGGQYVDRQGFKYAAAKSLTASFLDKNRFFPLHEPSILV